MAAETTAPKKVCVSCGEDVSAKPRTKDPEGKYYCAACYGKLQAGAAKPAASNGAPRPAAKVAMPPMAVKPGDPLHAHSSGPIPVAPPDDVMSKLAEEALAANSEQCPNCHRPWRKGSTLCTYCGFNSNSGKQLSTKVLRPETSKDDKQYDRGGAGKSAGAGGSSIPLLNYWLHPRDTVMAQIGTGSFVIPVLTFMLNGVLNAYSGASAKAASASGAAADVGIAPFLVGGAIGGLIGGAILAFVLRIAGSLVGGSGTFTAMYIAMGWAQLPALILTIAASVLAATMGSDPSATQLVLALVGVAFIAQACYTIAGISAAHEISIPAAIGTVIISLLLVFGAAFAIGFFLAAGAAGR